jgi:hypothetical protein
VLDVQYYAAQVVVYLLSKGGACRHIGIYGPGQGRQALYLPLYAVGHILGRGIALALKDVRYDPAL